MKTPLCIIVAMMLFLPIQANALFGHVAQEHQRRIETEQKLDQQEQTNRQLHTAISVLSAGGVSMLIIGAAVGSKAKRDHAANL